MSSSVLLAVRPQNNEALLNKSTINKAEGIIRNKETIQSENVN